ncbi:MAG: DUF4249 family protein [Candidatus Marinimicrobia bacterium]|nr:DUF4249 family protein [Candidatus Neomarinimicrobiota bacterium]
MRLFITNLFCLFLLACIAFEPELEWEDVTSDNEPVLNIMALLSSDTLVTSFVRVHRSLQMDEAADTLVRDTIEGNIFIYYASLFVVRDAEVIVSNGEYEYVFEYTDYVEDEGETVFSEVYLYYGDDLNPQPGETWTLSVTAPNGLSVTGETTIPPLPQLFKEQLPDTFQIDQTMDISWQILSDHYQIINVGNYLAYFYDYYFDEENWDYACGLWMEEIISPDEDSWTYRREICKDNPNLDWEEDYLLINLMSMDDNYFDYFIRYAEDPEFANLFLGEGGSGRNFGVEGGIGVFGAIGIDRLYMPIVP